MFELSVPDLYSYFRDKLSQILPPPQKLLVIIYILLVEHPKHLKRESKFNTGSCHFNTKLCSPPLHVFPTVYKMYVFHSWSVMLEGVFHLKGNFLVVTFTSTLIPCILSLISGGSRISPRRGRQLSRGGANIRFCQIFPKTAWNWKNLDPQGGRASKILLCRSATAYFNVPTMTNSGGST